MDKDFFIFDMDGTLLDSMFAWWELGGKYAEKLGITVTDEIASCFAFKSFNDAFSEFCTASGDNADISVDGLIGTLAELYTEKAKLKDGVYDFLVKSKLYGKRMCVITASQKRASYPILNKLGIYEFFDFIVTPEEFPKGKDSPEVFLYALEKFGCEAKDAAVFDDALYSIKTAALVGLYTVGIAEKYYSNQSDEISKTADHYAINGFTQLCEEYYAKH